jgi:hypothetical protein
MITFICFNIIEVKKNDQMEKENLQHTCFMIVYVYVLGATSKKRQKKTQQKKEEICVSCNPILQNFTFKIDTYVCTQICICISVRRVIASYIPTYSQWWSECWLISTHRCVVCVCLKGVESFSRLTLSWMKGSEHKREEEEREKYEQRKWPLLATSVVILADERCVNFTADDRRRWSIHLI